MPPLNENILIQISLYVKSDIAKVSQILSFGVKLRFRKTPAMVFA